MRRMLLVIASCTALVALVPSSALARHHHRAGTHARKHSRHHSQRARLRRFGTAAGQSSTGTGSTGGTSNGAGTVTGFDGTTLTITLNDGTVVNGKVTSASDITCQSASSQGGDDGQGDQGDQGGDQSSGSGDQGSGSGDQASGSSDQSVQNNDQSSSQGEGDSGQSSDGGGDQGGSQSCTPAVGMTVQSAELSVSGAGAIWKEVELSS